MKTRSLATLAVSLAAFFAAASAAEAQQVVVPPNPNDFSKRNISGGGTGNSSVGVKPPSERPQPAPIVIQLTVVSKERSWTNTDGQEMTARLLAFSAPNEGKTGPVEVIREDKVRFLLKGSKKPVDYPLAKLSQPDQIFVKAIAQAAKRDTANPGLEREKKEGEEKKE